MALIEPRSKLELFFPDSNEFCPATFEYSTAQVAIGDAYARQSTGLVKVLMTLLAEELWVLACMKGGNPSKPFPLLKLRSPSSKEPRSASAAISCVLHVTSVNTEFHGDHVADRMLACHKSLV